MRDSCGKGAGMRDQDPPFQTLCEGRFNYAIFNKHKTLNSLRFQITRNLENASIPASVCVLSSDF